MPDGAWGCATHGNFSSNLDDLIAAANHLRTAHIAPSLFIGHRLGGAAGLAEDGQVSYMGVNQYSRKWSRIKTYGGKLVENITQAAARDVLTSNMPAIEEAGYSIVLSVHDELLTEAPDTPDYTHEHLSALMATNPEWAPGLPLAAAGFEAYRYRKD